MGLTMVVSGWALLACTDIFSATTISRLGEEQACGKFTRVRSQTTLVLYPWY